MESIGHGFEPDKNLGLQDFSRGFFEGARLYIENKNIRSDSGIAIVVGLVAAFPEKLNYQTFNNSPEFHQLCATGHVAVLINDYMDMQDFLSKPEGEETKAIIENEWKKTLEGIGFCQSLPEEKKKVLKSYMAGITLLDDYVRSHPDNSSKGISKAKEIENAISLVHCAAMVLNPEEINANCFNLHEDISRKSLEEKYSWLINGEHQNETQRRLCALFNVVMLSQTVDDYNDFKVDDKLNIRNIYSSVLRENDGNQNIAIKQFLKIQKLYQDRAMQFGVSKMAAIGNKVVLGIYKKMQYLFPFKYGGYRERLLK